MTCPNNMTVDTDLGSPTVALDYSSSIIKSDNSGELTISPDLNITFPVDIGIGATHFTFTATDSSGNYKTCTFTITVQDTEQPILTCPSNNTVLTDIGVALVDYSGSITVNDNSGEVITLSPDPYVEFPAYNRIGIHNFTFTATDSSGNFVNCTFTITVES
ncbi:hyalin-like [Anneissia japonica]|uniref:hyalin-like n=1 Tax=Anneissia japonica TaxID=1529436 RepID=UPI00142556FB|nr:hyalin-like [Anneissia japonica]